MHKEKMRKKQEEEKKRRKEEERERKKEEEREKKREEEVIARNRTNQEMLVPDWLKTSHVT